MSAVPEAVESTREAVAPRARPSAARKAGGSGARALLPVPVATIVALGIHFAASTRQLPAETRSYTIFLLGVLGVTLLALVAQAFWRPVREWMKEMGPIFAAAIVLLCIWEVITAGFRLLPMPYFPGPEACCRA